MRETFGMVAELAGGDAQLFALAAVFTGALLAIFGLVVMLRPQDAVERRLSLPASGGVAGSDLALRVAAERDTTVLTRLVAPTDERERSAIRLRLLQAGYRGDSVFVYYFVRTMLGLVLPLPLLAAVFLYSFQAGGFDVPVPVLGISLSSTLIPVTLLMILGFYGPPFWLRRRIRARQQAIRESFPYALDVMQLCVEAGLGFDAALARVAQELAQAHPVLAGELETVGVELRAGMSRNQVLARLVERTGVDEVRAFATVVQQSLEFGTSISEALMIFAKEMRNKRMLAGEEKANQLSVKMSVVMVLLLLPTMFVVALGPAVIRIVGIFSAGGILGGS